jgi:uncharacterized membrane protein
LKTATPFLAVFESLFDVPLLIAGPVIIGSLCLFGVIGLLVVRRYILPKLRIHDSDSGFCSAMQQAVMVFYGLVVALILVNAWQHYSDVANVISQEATAVAVLYRDVSSDPEPSRSQLQKQLREYVVQIIRQAWPLQQRGEIPSADVKMMDTFQATLNSFEPLTEGQKVLHAESMRDYDRLVVAHGLRLDAVQVRLPNVLWFIIIAGALISLSSSFFFRVEDVWLQGIQVSLLAAFIGIAIFLIFTFDRPFRGELGLRPDSYQLVYDQLMKP